MSLSSLEKSSKTEDTGDGAGLFSIPADKLRLLAENPWNGGGGYTFAEVSQMTLDQIWGRLCELKILSRPVGKRTGKAHPLTLMKDSDGLVKGRAADGTEMKAKITGKSKARMLREAAEAKKQKERRRRRR